MNGSRGLSERLLGALIDLTSDIIIVKDADDLRFVLVNRAGEVLLDAPRDRVLGQSDHDLFPAEQADAVVSLDRAVLVGDVPMETAHEEILGTPRGPRLLRTRRVPIRDDRGRPRYLLAISEDLTERAAAARQREDLERQLQEAQRMHVVGQLCAGVAHDFNNLLTVILVAGRTLIQELDPDRPERLDVEDIVASALRGTELTRQLLTFSRREKVQPRALDLNVLVTNFERLLRRLIGNDIILQTVPARHLGLVRADPGQLEQVIANLVINARDAMPDGGTLTLATANIALDEQFAWAHPDTGMGPHVMLSVSDTGTGMSADVQARIFEPFYTTKEPDKGSGLGLSTVQRVVRQNGGSIQVVSEPGRGTTFCIYLPQTFDVESAPRDDLAAPAKPNPSATILVVEDDAAVRRLTVRLLQGYGYRVLSASDPEAGVLLAAEHRGLIHLLVTDVIMPGTSGPSLAARLSASRPELAVLFMSGHSDDVLEEHGVLDPTVALLRKPFTPFSLARHVRRVLDRP